MATTLPLHNQEGQAIGSISFGGALPERMETAILWQTTKAYLANERQGNADTKTRAEVSGGGKKPWRQKHTGRARAGSIRSPIWRGGGIVFGPHPREYRSSMPQKVRRAALGMSLKARLEDEGVCVVESLEGLSMKTKAFSALLKKLNASQGALVVVEKPNGMLARIARNIPKVCVKPASDVTSLDLLRFKRVVVTKQALVQLEAMLS